MRHAARQVLRALPFLAAAMVAACATPQPPAISPQRAKLRAALDSLGLLSADQRTPRVRLRVEQAFGRPSDLTAVVRLEDDAYVMVVNVGPDGYAQVIFPQDAKDDGLLRAGRSYRLPAFFPGFATGVFASAAGQEFVAFSRSEYASPMVRGPGYVFAIASDEPLHLDDLVRDGLFDEYRVPEDGLLLDPRYMMQFYADAAVPGGAAGVGASLARYAGWAPVARRAMASYCSAFSYGFGGVRFVTQPGTSVYGAQFLGMSLSPYGLQSPIWALTAAPSSLRADCMYEDNRPIYMRGLMPPNHTPPQPVDSAHAPVDSGKAGGLPKAFNPPKPPPKPVIVTDGETLELGPKTRGLAREQTYLNRQRDALERGEGMPAWGRPARGGRPMTGGEGTAIERPTRTETVRLPAEARETIVGAGGTGGSSVAPVAPATPREPPSKPERPPE